MGVIRVDPHIKVLDERVRSLAISRGLDAIVYAPHFTPLPTIVERARRYSDDRLLVVPARELFTGTWRTRKHVLAIGLADPIPDFLDLETTMEALHEQDAAVIAPHPGYLSMSLSPEDVLDFRAQIDAVEVYNPKFLPHHARRARQLADRVDRPPIVSSYAHLRRTVGVASIHLEGAADSPDDIVEAIKSGAIVGHSRPPVPQRWVSHASELTHLLWENTGQKSARLLSPKTEATHPSAPIYDGRFDGISE